ncbi:alpha/beta hydrolase [Allochromatium humboldtianum]|uniref:Alpha/beta hydrolase n=1 Tax=Allochromatium humboldtianum TaxID=504901 RepID=A0A850R1S7_9GAMM|nr:alpha/beta hydrolase [Allochromatium humboldtianum]NVZ08579.1 alpha/beta hydrolase [Allochromatium humboldtianum]
MDTLESYQTQLADPDSRFIEVAGFRLHYKRQGSGETLILLLHGSFLSLKSWSAVMAPLAERATVVAFDRPVCGLTSRPLPKRGDRGPSPYSAEAQGELVAELIAALGFERAILVGSSTGGTIALMTALRRPECVQGLILVDAMVYSGYATSEVPAPVLAMMRALKPAFTRLMGFMIDRLYEKAIRKFWYRQERLSDETLAEFKRDFMLGPWNKAFMELFLATRRLNLDPRLGALNLPTLVVTGEHDRAVKPEESERLAKAIAGAELQVIADAGHLPQEERPEAFLAAIDGFLTRTVRSLEI